MNFVRDNGVEQIQSVLNMKRPYELVTQYSRLMFASYFFMPQQKQVLIVGLGGGAMIHFYEHYDAETKIDAVEIDEKVVQLAEKFFDVRTRKNTTIITEDAFLYFKSNKTRYDVIYMDAFLKPSEKTDATGQPLRLKTVEFYKGLREQLTPEGIVVINLNIHQRTNDDLATIRSAYPQVYTFKAPTPNMIVVCTWGKTRAHADRLAREGHGARPPLQGDIHVSERTDDDGAVSRHQSNNNRRGQPMAGTPKRCKSRILRHRPGCSRIRQKASSSSPSSPAATFRSCKRSRNARACASDRKKLFQPICQRFRHPVRLPCNRLQKAA